MKILIGSLLVGCFGIHLACAQHVASTKTPPDRRRFYVSLQLAEGSYELYYDKTILTPTVAQVASPFMMGFYLTDRLAIQAGYGRESSNSNNVGGYERTPSGQVIRHGITLSSETTYLLPVTLRYALSRRRPRLRADLLLGLAYAHSAYDYDAHTEVDGVTVGPHTTDSGQGGQVCLTGGLSGRFVFNRHFEAVVDYMINRNLKDMPAYTHQQVTGNRWGLTRSISLGLRYRFNLHKPIAQPAP